MIQRYEVSAIQGIINLDTGRFVQWEDHLAELARLKEEINRKDLRIESLHRDIETSAAMLDRATHKLATLKEEHGREVEELKNTYRCFHCGFETSDRAEAETHFGDGEGEPAICIAWSGMEESERLHDYQQINMELNVTRDENTTLRAERDELRKFKDRFGNGCNNESECCPYYCMNEDAEKNINMLIDFIPDGWEMPLGYTQLVEQIKSHK